MTDKPWYTFTGIILRALRTLAIFSQRRKSLDSLVKFAALYGLIEIFGVKQSFRIFRAVAEKTNREVNKKRATTIRPNAKKPYSSMPRV